MSNEIRMMSASAGGGEENWGQTREDRVGKARRLLDLEKWIQDRVGRTAVVEGERWKILEQKNEGETGAKPETPHVLVRQTKAGRTELVEFTVDDLKARNLEWK